ncbi:hypothetical protein ACP3TD_06100 [Pseudarthrobacter sp. 1G09]|uniref:hypothetical protein n=1 Tax=Pseudarthrobacter sp. 1G09 TaxID=3416178 RepID=UPI003CE9D3A3
MIEAKRIRYGSFQPEQLAREYITLMSMTGPAIPLLLLLGVAPPVRVKGNGLLDIPEAVGRFLAPVLDRVSNEKLPSASLLMARLPDVVCWISWPELDDVIRESTATFYSGHPSGDASIQRLAAFVRNAVAWHA